MAPIVTDSCPSQGVLVKRCRVCEWKGEALPSNLAMLRRLSSHKEVYVAEAVCVVLVFNPTLFCISIPMATLTVSHAHRCA